MTTYLIAAHNLTRTYRIGDTPVTGIHGVNLKIGNGELAILRGDSGSGKSTLLSLLAGLDRPSSGALTVAGYDLNHADESQLTHYRRQVVGIIFQAFNLLPTLSVQENICLPGLMAGRPRESVDARAAELTAWLGIDNRTHHFPGQLSGGEMQRTAIARALINEPALILADEPTGNLDSRNGQMVIDLLAELNRTFGTTVIIATHSQLADAVATVSLCLKDGKLIDHQCTHSAS